jgi:thioredoxin 1
MEIDESQFSATVLDSDLPVLVDFYAPWCGPCRMMAPVLDSIATTFAGRIKVIKINVDNASSLAVKYGISGIPTLTLFHAGEPRETLVGMVAQQTLKGQIETFLNSQTSVLT